VLPVSLHNQIALRVSHRKTSPKKHALANLSFFALKQLLSLAQEPDFSSVMHKITPNPY
jgi:hypothetical protein